MRKRVVGIGRQRPWGVLLSLTILAGASLLLMRTVLAVHETGRFELDGDATSSAADDWDKVCYEDGVNDGLTPADAAARCGTAVPTTGATAVSWVSEPDRAASIFTGGGSKDPQEISEWLWKDAGGLPDKDNLRHAYAVRYSLPATAADGSCPNGTGGANEPPFDPSVPCVVLYFGSDRFDNSGDAQQGFWFLQNKVDTNGAPGGGGTRFTGLHTPGDLLIISDFSIGGTVSTINIYRWDPVCTATNKPTADCADANLRFLRGSTAANCNTVVGANDAFCGLVNGGVISLPWAFLDKSNTPSNGALAGEFYEAGVNLSKLSLAGECFSSVSAETRSSTSTTAVLKDFILGQFANCAPGMTTQASATVDAPVVPGAAVFDTATIAITGGTNPPDPTGIVTFFLCGPIASGDCSTGGTNVGTGTLNGGANTTDGIATAQSPNVNTISSATGILTAGRYCFRAEWPGDANYGPASHTNDTTECFAVRDTSAITTAQVWLPNDTAHVTTASGAAPLGTVSFTLFPSADCTGTPIATFANRPVDANGNAATNNANTFVVLSSSVVSWRSVFTPADPNAITGSTSHCEATSLTINNDIGS
jgi:hypothetical protein